MPQMILITSKRKGETVRLVFQPDVKDFSARYPIVGGTYAFYGVNNPATITGYGKWGTVKEAHEEMETQIMAHLHQAGLIDSPDDYTIESKWMPINVPGTV